MSDRIVVMNQGRIEQQGTPKDLYYRPATRFVAGFFGDSNLIPGRLTADLQRVETPLGALPYGFAAPGAAPGGAVILAIRPEMLILAENGGIAAEVEEVVFGGAATRLLLRAAAAPEIKLDLQLAGDAIAAAGDRVSLRYDPAQAVVVPA
jgi:ABC-type Fe3+/spermidine/putrescine transport system ATPase subunit